PDLLDRRGHGDVLHVDGWPVPQLDAAAFDEHAPAVADGFDEQAISVRVRGAVESRRGAAERALKAAQVRAIAVEQMDAVTSGRQRRQRPEVAHRARDKEKVVEFRFLDMDLPDVGGVTTRAI